MVERGKVVSKAEGSGEGVDPTLVSETLCQWLSHGGTEERLVSPISSESGVCCDNQRDLSVCEAKEDAIEKVRENKNITF